MKKFSNNLIDISNKLSKEQRNFLDLIKKLIEKKNYKGYIVGGIVRDYFLCRELVDLDIAIEGNGLEIANELSKIGEIKILEKSDRFLTAKVRYKDLIVDITTTREEIYHKPAVLPCIKPSTIEEDLKRRDFSINAMAISLNNFSLIDPTGGLLDLKNKKIRVLHQRSFIDDPTRIFRAIRYATRFSFKIERNTFLLMREAIKKNYLNLLSKDRILNEIKLILEDEEPVLAFRRLKNIGVFKVLKINLKNDFGFYFKQKKFADKLKIKLDWTNYALCFFKDVDFLLSFNLEKKQRVFFELAKNTKNILLTLKKAKKNSQIYLLVEKFDDKFLAYLACFFFKKMKNFIKAKAQKPLLVAKDLINLNIKPSPLFGKILKKIYLMQIDGVIKTKEDAIKCAKSLYLQIKENKL